MSYPTVPICRICLSNDELQVSLYSGYAQRRALLTKIRVCLPIKITPGDTLPVTVCSQCIEKLDQFYDYHCKSETSQRILTEGEGNWDARYHRITRARHIDQTAPCPSISAAPTIANPLPDVIKASKTMNDETEQLLTQSPQVKKAAAADGPNDVASEGSTMSFLHNTQNSKRRNKHKSSSKYKDFICY
ncbi:uncharacterized protein LOC131288479 [Anopheles ziemanni]|uniref:uncharacterized protein LOC131288479 n=1 Tax=Anopheles ziemanni TaxID=345580 RepID=UPI00265DE12B|nr:uncharacterized protein LOC131288479 [Anopheles ziemanni]